MSTMKINIRPAKHEDLDNINRVIEAAIMTWNLPERVKRLSLSSYLYTSIDFDHLDIVVVEDDSHGIVAIAAWEQADANDVPDGKTALLLHGIYVHPLHQRQEIGQQLLKRAEQAVLQHHFDALLVKAQTGAEGFFLKQGMSLLPVENTERHYASRYWKSVAANSVTTQSDL